MALPGGAGGLVVAQIQGVALSFHPVGFQPGLAPGNLAKVKNQNSNPQNLPQPKSHLKTFLPDCYLSRTPVSTYSRADFPRVGHGNNLIAIS